MAPVESDPPLPVLDVLSLGTSNDTEDRSSPDDPTKKIDDWWGPAKTVLGDMKFLQKLKDYDRDNIDEKLIKKIRKKFAPNNPDFQPDLIRKSSVACEGLLVQNVGRRP